MKRFGLMRFGLMGFGLMGFILAGFILSGGSFVPAPVFAEVLARPSHTIWNHATISHASTSHATTSHASSNHATTSHASSNHATTSHASTNALEGLHAQSHQPETPENLADTSEPAVTFFIDVSAVTPNNFALVPVKYRVRSDTTVNISQFGFVIEYEPGSIDVVGMDTFSSAFWSFQPFTFTDVGLIEFTASGLEEVFLEGEGTFGDLQMLTFGEGGTPLRFTESELRTTETVVSDTPVPHVTEDSYLFVTNGVAVFAGADTLTVTAGGGSEEVPVTVVNDTGASWTATVDAGSAGWLSIVEDMPQTGSGSFTLVSLENTGEESRTGVVEVSVDGSSLPPFEMVVIQEATGPPLEEFSVSYPLGWNMVSVPFAMDNMDEEAIFSPVTPGTLYRFSGTYIQVDALSPGTGYWLQFSGPGSGTFAGTPVDELTLSMNVGWNLIPALASEAVINDPEGLVMAGTLYSYDGVYSLVETLQPGRGYWVSCRSAGEITIQLLED